MKPMRLMRAIATAAFVVSIVPFELAAQNYRVIDLGTLVSGTFSNAMGINNKGEVVGFATLANDTELHAFLWRKGVMKDLGTLAPTDTLPVSAAVSINDRDDIVGFSETSESDPLGEDFCGFGDHLICLSVIWTNGIISSLPTLGGNNGQAADINNRGQVVGIAETAENDPICPPPQMLVFKPTVWENGQPRALSTAPFMEGLIGGLPNGSGVINQTGQIVGVAVACDFSGGEAVLWRGNTAINMGTVRGFGLSPVAINNKGQATGTYTTDTGLNRGFLWQNGMGTDLGSLPNDPQVFGNAINDRGQVVGQTCDLTESSCTSFVWQRGVMSDLNAVVPPDSTLFMVDPVGINSAGEIVGLAVEITPNGLLCCHGFLAIPDSRVVASGTTGQARMREAQTIVIPENLHRVLRRLGRHIRGLGVPKD